MCNRASSTLKKPPPLLKSEVGRQLGEALQKTTHSPINIRGPGLDIALNQSSNSKNQKRRVFSEFYLKIKKKHPTIWVAKIGKNKKKNIWCLNAITNQDLLLD